MRDVKGFDHIWWIVPLAEVITAVSVVLYFMRLVGT